MVTNRIASGTTTHCRKLSLSPRAGASTMGNLAIAAMVATVGLNVVSDSFKLAKFGEFALVEEAKKHFPILAHSQFKDSQRFI